MRVKGHTVAFGALQPKQGNVILPALAMVLPVNDDALRGQAALKVIPLLRVVVTQSQHIARWVPAKPRKEGENRVRKKRKGKRGN